MTTPPSEPTPPGPELPEGRPSPYYRPVPEHLYGTTQHPAPHQLPPASRTMAGWALALAIIPCGIGWLIAIGLAIAVLVQGRDGRDHGKGMAIAALIIAPLWIVVAVVAGIVSAVGDLTSDADRDSSGHVTGHDTISIMKLREGDCFDQDALFTGGGEDEVDTSEAEVMPCSEPHQFETYLVFEVPDGDYPGAEKLRQLAARKCFGEFRDFVGTPYGRSRLEPYIIYPQPGSWKLFDDRGITCMVGEPGRLSTGTLENSRR